MVGKIFLVVVLLLDKRGALNRSTEKLAVSLGLSSSECILIWTGILTARNDPNEKQLATRQVEQVFCETIFLVRNQFRIHSEIPNHQQFRAKSEYFGLQSY